MRLVSGEFNSRKFDFGGVCPHCGVASLFVGLAPGASIGGNRFAAAMQCQSCNGAILGIAHIVNYGVQYSSHAPSGKPDQNVAEEVPEHIRLDFQEALRCMFVSAYNGATEMCRRALEAACLERGAPPSKVLEKMIDWLEDERVITPFLKEVAHKIRLGGNRAAHPPAEGDQAQNGELGPVVLIEREHAEAIVNFTREFFHHIYVVPKQMAKYDFSKPK